MSDPDEIARIIAEPRSVVSLRERDFRFYSAIAEAAGNRVVSAHLATALDTMVPFTLHHSPEAVARAWEEHRDIIDAIRSGKAEAAAEAMRLHLCNSRDRRIDAIGRRA